MECDSDEDVEALADEMLAAAAARSDSSEGDEDVDLEALATDLLSDEPALRDSGSAVSGNLEQRVAEILSQAQLPKNASKMYGSNVDTLGNGIQLKLVAKLFHILGSAWRQKHSAKPSTSSNVVIRNFVLDATMKSMTVVASQNKMSLKSVKNNLEASAAAMLYGGCWLLGVCCLHWRAIFKAKKLKPILFINKFKYDETPLRLRVSELDDFFQQKGLCHQFQQQQLAQAKEAKTPETKRDYRFVKIFRVFWTIGTLDFAKNRFLLILERAHHQQQLQLQQASDGNW